MMIEIDVDECPEISSALKIKVLPTFINFIKRATTRYISYRRPYKS